MGASLNVIQNSGRASLLARFLRRGMMSSLALSVLLAGCTATHTPTPYLPSREGIASGETITVQGNKNLYAIAREHNVSMREIIVLNNLQPPYVVKSGQSLVLPSGASGGSSMGEAGLNIPLAAPQGAIQSAELPPVQSAPIQTIPLDQPNGLRPLKPMTPQTQVEALNTPTPAPSPLATTVTQGSAPHPLGQTPPSAPLTETPATASPTSLAPAAAAPAAIVPEAINMVWPVQGPVLSKFGPKGQGMNNDGVNIAAPKGAPVVAAANGIVVYAGNEMKGFGNLVLIRHQGGWVTAYAHLDRALVTKDAVVAQGDMIGTVGKTGNVASPQLHFETRFKDKAVDPSGVVKEQ